MEKIFFCLLISILMLNGTLYAEMNHEISLKKSLKTGLTISNKTVNGFSAVNTIGHIGVSKRKTPGGLFTEIAIGGYTKNHRHEGTPHLPVFTKLIEIPYGADIKVVVNSYDDEIIGLTQNGFTEKLMPVQPSFSKNISKREAFFSYRDLSYSKDAYNNVEIVQFEKIGVLRGSWIGRLTISPLRYNPVKNSLKVFNNINFTLDYKNADTVFSEKMKRKYLSPVFKTATGPIEMLPTFKTTSKAATEDDSIWPLTYVIIAHSGFRGAKLNEFIQWKRASGFNVIDIYTDGSELDTSTTATLRSSIKTYLQSLYESSTPQSYILFIGDVELIPSCEGVAGTTSHVTDLYYCTYDGASDYIPDAYYGRFPADNPSDLEAMIDKTIQYEKYDFTNAADENYLDNYMFIAGLDDDFQVSHANAQVNYATTEYFDNTYKYLAPDYTGVSNLSNEIKDNFNTGMGFVNYTGHCFETGWQDELSNGDVASLSENDMFGLVIGNCCLSNKFDYDDCLGETLIKKKQSGAVGYIGASGDTLWDEDVYWAVGKPSLELSNANTSNHTFMNTETGVYDGLFHTGLTADQWYITAGQIVQRGNLSVSESTSLEAQYYWEVYHLMGDPSLIPFLEKPSVYSTTPSITELYACGTTKCTINNLEENSYVGLSQNGLLLDAAYSGGHTSVDLTFSALDSTSDATLVIIKQNVRPYINDSIEVTNGNATLEANFTINETEVFSTSTIHFNNLSSGCNNIYSWTFDGLNTGSSEAEPDIIYDKIGLFDVRLVATDHSGTDMKMESDYIKVSPKIIALQDEKALEADGTCVITFNELSKNHDEITSWLWTFPGGIPATSNLENPNILYDKPDWYSASLVVTKGGIEYTSQTINLRIRDIVPVASFTYDEASLEAGETIQFEDTTQSVITERYWYFTGGTPQLSQEKNPVVVFETGGEHVIMMRVVNGSSDHAVNKTILIKPFGSGVIEAASKTSSGSSCFIDSL